MLLCSSLSASLTAGEGLLPNWSFETAAGERPRGWRMFTTPQGLDGDFYVTDGESGRDTHSGRRALQFRFPAGASLSQAVWMCDPRHGGIEASPGSYSCAFWIKSGYLSDGFHAWVSVTGFDRDGQRIDEIARSDYLGAAALPAGSWNQVQFEFELTSDGAVAYLAPAVVFKTSPDGSANAVPADFRILVDDLVLERY